MKEHLQSPDCLGDKLQRSVMKVRGWQRSSGQVEGFIQRVNVSLFLFLLQLTG